MGSRGKIELFLTRCSLNSQVVPAALAASFPSSICLMGAGEREQGATYPPARPHLRPIHSTPSCSLVPGKEDGNEMRTFPGQLQTQTDQISSLTSAHRHLCKGQEGRDILESLLCAKCCTTLTLDSFTEQIERLWILGSVHPTRLLAGDPSAPLFPHLKLGISIAFTSKTVVKIK